MPQCAAHNRETLLRCGRCDAPICPDCTVFGPAGARCRDCAALRSSHVYQLDTPRLTLAIVAALALAVVAGWAAAAVAPSGIFIQFWLGLLIGGAVGETTWRLSGRKRGMAIEAGAGACAGLGMLAGHVLSALPALQAAGPPGLAMVLDWPGLVVGVGVATASAVSRIRYRW